MDYSTRQTWTTSVTPPGGKRQYRLAAALGVEQRALEAALGAAHHNLHRLRELTLSDVSALEMCMRDAQRIFYLVQWERLQAHLELHGELPASSELAPLLETLNPIFQKHFSRTSRLNEALIARYRAELSGRTDETCLKLPSPAKRFLAWLGLAHP